MPTKLVTGPSVEPVTLAEAKLHLRVDTTDLDSQITSFVTDARLIAESITRRSFVTQQWRLVLDQFPAPGMSIGSANWYGPQYGVSPGPLTTLRTEGTTGFEIMLDHCPVASVESITYIDLNGATQVLDPSAYKLDVVTEPCRIVPGYASTWPGTRSEINAVSVYYTAGYGAAADVPEPIKTWIKMRVGSAFENYQSVITGRGITAIEVPFVDGLLDAYRVLSY